jgi:hypothetical protein
MGRSFLVVGWGQILHRTGLVRPAIFSTTMLARLFLAGLNRARFSSLTTRAGQVGGGLFSAGAWQVLHGLMVRGWRCAVNPHFVYVHPQDEGLMAACVRISA